MYVQEGDTTGWVVSFTWECNESVALSLEQSEVLWGEDEVEYIIGRKELLAEIQPSEAGLMYDE